MSKANLRVFFYSWSYYKNMKSTKEYLKALIMFNIRLNWRSLCDMRDIANIQWDYFLVISVLLPNIRYSSFSTPKQITKQLQKKKCNNCIIMRGYRQHWFFSFFLLFLCIKCIKVAAVCLSLVNYFFLNTYVHLYISYNMPLYISWNRYISYLHQC